VLSGVLGLRSASADPQPSAPPLPVVQSGTGVGTRIHGTGGQIPTNSGNRDATKPAFLAEFMVMTNSGGDHHIEKISVQSNSSHGWPVRYRTTVAFHNQYVDNCGWTEPGSVLDSWCERTYHFDFTYRVGLYTPRPFWTDGATADYELVSANFDCTGPCTKPLSAPPAGHRFVLSGFTVNYVNDNRYVQRVSILPYTSPGKVTVRFKDDGSPRFQGNVSGVFLPDRAFKSAKKEVTLTYTPGKPTPKLNLGYDAFALIGFDFEFLNGNHKLNTVGLKYQRPYLTPVFNDRNTDDPWRVRIQYALLRM
jgi:hypothetical protein